MKSRKSNRQGLLFAHGRSMAGNGVALALALGAVIAAVPAGAATMNLVDNGDFETVDNRIGNTNSAALDQLASPPGATWDVYNSLPGGWEKTTGSGGIEIQTNTTIPLDAHSGSHYVELDSSTNQGFSNSGMTQNVTFANAGTYLLSFWYSPRVNTVDVTSNNTNIISYSLGTLVTGTVSGPSLATPWNQWTEITNQRAEQQHLADPHLPGNGPTGNPRRLHRHRLHHRRAPARRRLAVPISPRWPGPCEAQAATGLALARAPGDNHLGAGQQCPVFALQFPLGLVVAVHDADMARLYPHALHKIHQVVLVGVG